VPIQRDKTVCGVVMLATKKSKYKNNTKKDDEKIIIWRGRMARKPTPTSSTRSTK
jgi:hypothetical protein